MTNKAFMDDAEHLTSVQAGICRAELGMEIEATIKVLRGTTGAWK